MLSNLNFNHRASNRPITIIILDIAQGANLSRSAFVILTQAEIKREGLSPVIGKKSFCILIG